MQYTYWDFFPPTAQNSFWTWFWCLFSDSHFLFYLFHNSKTFSSRETNKRSHLGWDWVNREGGAHGSCHFWSKTTEHSVVWTGALVNHPPWNGQTRWKNLQKNSLKLNAASHNNASWCTDTDGFLEHLPSGGSLYYKWPTLQKIIPLGGGVSPSSNIK